MRGSIGLAPTGMRRGATAAIALALGILIAAPAFAEGGDHDRREHERWEHERGEHRGYWRPGYVVTPPPVAYYGQAPVYYAPPPPVYYAPPPPPAYYAPPSLNVVIPLR